VGDKEGSPVQLRLRAACAVRKGTHPTHLPFHTHSSGSSRFKSMHLSCNCHTCPETITYSVMPCGLGQPGAPSSTERDSTHANTHTNKGLLKSCCGRHHLLADLWN
jgi:hypothetical protein